MQTGFETCESPHIHPEELPSSWLQIILVSTLMSLIYDALFPPPPPSQQSAHFQRWYQRACRNNFSTRIKAEDLFGIRSANRVALPVAIIKTHYHRSSITRESCTLLFFNYRPLTLLAPGHQRVIPIPSWEWLLKTLVSLWERFFRFSFSFASILEYF